MDLSPGTLMRPFRPIAFEDFRGFMVAWGWLMVVLCFKKELSQCGLSLHACPCPVTSGVTGF